MGKWVDRLVRGIIIIACMEAVLLVGMLMYWIGLAIISQAIR